jgi:single-strand DNA-binding protein
MISATVTGNVGKQPELKTSRSGKPLVSFSVASTYNPKNGEPTTTWVDVVCFDEQAEQVAERVNKGDRVCVTGRLELEKFQRKDGTEGSALRMVADEVGLSLRWGKRERVTAGAEEDVVIPF